MICVSKAVELITRHSIKINSSFVALNTGAAKVLMEDIKADRPYPPFNKALMDGIAFSFAGWQKGCREFYLEKVISAGGPIYVPQNTMNAVQIMTGAVLPKSFDVIVPIEQVVIKKNIASVLCKKIVRCQFIRQEGKDASKAKVLLNKGIRLTPAHIGLIASVGRSMVKVAAPFKVSVISTGDELIAPGKRIKYYQARTSNSFAVKAALEATSLGSVRIRHVTDDPPKMRTMFQERLNCDDIVVICGGVSKGSFDHVPDVLYQLGVKKIFHGVAQKPGKPLLFGVWRGGKPVFALPGNPASSLVCTYRYIIPYLYHCAGTLATASRICIDHHAEPCALVQFIPVKEGKIIESGGSGDMAAWADADGFIEYDTTTKGNIRPYFSWRT